MNIDDLNSKKGSDGFISKEDYLKYAQEHACRHHAAPIPDSESEILEIHIEMHHLQNGSPEDPCLCPVALALKEMLENCDVCEVWRDHITIDHQDYETTPEMTEFIDYFDQHGCMETAEEMLRGHFKKVFRLPVMLGAHSVKKQQVPESDEEESGWASLDSSDSDSEEI